MNRAQRRAAARAAQEVVVVNMRQAEGRVLAYYTGQKHCKVVRAGRGCFEVRTGKFLYGTRLSKKEAHSLLWQEGEKAFR